MVQYQTEDNAVRLHSLELVTQHSHFVLIHIHSEWLYYSEHLNVVEGAPYSQEEKDIIQFCKWKDGINGFWYMVNDLAHLLNDFPKYADTLKFALHTNCIIYELKKLLSLFAWTNLGFDSHRRQTQYFLSAPISHIVQSLVEGLDEDRLSYPDWIYPHNNPHSFCWKFYLKKK